MTRACDVAVVGGGPAGCATALCLRAHAPTLSICIIESSRYEGQRLGETLPPLARRLLEHLGVWEEFQQETPREVHGTTAHWGGPDPRDNDFIYVPRGSGWHVDRAAFDAMLARVGAARGTEVLLSTRVRSVEEMPKGWRLKLSDGAARFVRFVVDATGRSALIARTRGARFVQIDHLAGFSRFFDDSGGDPRTLVEACSYGWWYTAGLPGGRRVAACVTDADLGAACGSMSLRVLPASSQRPALCGTRSTGPEARGPVRARSTESRYLEPASGAGWLAVGDAASIFDPLSSQGIVKVLLIIHGRGDTGEDLRRRVAAASRDKDSALAGLALPVIMNLRGKGALTVPDVFETLGSSVSATIAIVTADDIGGFARSDTPGRAEYNARELKLKPRARENIWVEVGWFWGHLGRSKVFLWLKEDVLLPTDLQGAAWTQGNLEQSWPSIESFLTNLRRPDMEPMGTTVDGDLSRT